MDNTEKRELEQKALAMHQAGKPQEEIEKDLQHEFIFYKDVFTRKIVSALFWK
jgi:hypothetical protein